MNKKQILNLSILVLAISIFLMFSIKNIDFTYDDSFITYRYSDNLANGHGFSWNYDGKPEFGFTSYLQTILVAGGIKLGFDAVTFSKIITIFSGTIAIIIVGLIVREFTERKFEYYFLSSLVLGCLPGFGLHAISGMETTLYIMFFTLSAYSYLVFLRTNKRKHLVIVLTLIIITAFTRYEGAFLSIGIMVHQIFNSWILKNSINFKKIGIFCIPIIFMIGILVWNHFYFDEFLPNPFTLKTTTGFSDIVRNVYAISFVLVFMIGHILLILLNFKEIIKNPKSSYFMIQIIISLSPFLFISQWGNFEHRYTFQIIPLIISLSIFSFYLMKPKIILAQKHPKFIISIIIILLVTYNIPTNWDVTDFADGFSNGLEQSHIKIGKILGNYDHLKHNTIATVVDAGAVPFYSEWRVYDYTLNDSHYVKHGIDADYFYQQKPALITLNYQTYQQGIPQDDLVYFEERIIKSLKTSGEFWALHPEFENYKILTVYPSILIFVEKEFANQNPQLMQELIDNSSPSQSIP